MKVFVNVENGKELAQLIVNGVEKVALSGDRVDSEIVIEESKMMYIVKSNLCDKYIDKKYSHKVVEYLNGMNTIFEIMSMPVELLGETIILNEEVEEILRDMMFNRGMLNTDYVLYNIETDRLDLSKHGMKLREILLIALRTKTVFENYDQLLDYIYAEVLMHSKIEFKGFEGVKL